MECRFEKYYPDATHVYAHVPGSNRSKVSGTYRLFKNGGTWGDNGTTRTVPVKQLRQSTFVSVSGPNTFSFKIPRKDGITGKEAALLPVGGSIPRVVGSERSEDPRTFGYYKDPSNANPYYNPLNYGQLRNTDPDNQPPGGPDGAEDNALKRRGPGGGMDPTAMYQDDIVPNESVSAVAPAAPVVPDQPGYKGPGVDPSDLAKRIEQIAPRPDQQTTAPMEGVQKTLKKDTAVPKDKKDRKGKGKATSLMDVDGKSTSTMDVDIVGQASSSSKGQASRSNENKKKDNQNIAQVLVGLGKQR